MLRDPTFAEYLSTRDATAIGKLTPERLRVGGYEEILKRLLEEMATWILPFGRRPRPQPPPA
jgi:hypothetical protein